MSPTWSVSDLNRYVRQTLLSDYRLQGVRVSGEISGFRAYPSGHWYFTLKDAAAQVSCVMWRGRAEKQQARFLPRDGDAVEVQGDVNLYEARGQYQLEVAWLEPAGEGRLYQEFVRLKTRLEAEGLFAAERKRPLPRQARLIGLVTSPAGAALRDVLNVLRRRSPQARVLLSPAAVQGEAAPAQIAAALQALAAWQPEVIIVARGGGSLEDLWAFNAEEVARAIARMPAPVISGVGHETDFTIADFVADLRAPTPSAAAELATPVTRDDWRAAVDDLSLRLREALQTDLGRRGLALAGQQARLRGLTPQARLAHARQRLQDLQARLAAAALHRQQLEQERLNGLRQALQGVSPLRVLERGYALVTRPDGSVVQHAAEVQPDDPLRVRVRDGEFGVRVSPR